MLQCRRLGHARLLIVTSLIRGVASGKPNFGCAFRHDSTPSSKSWLRPCMVTWKLDKCICGSPPVSTKRFLYLTLVRSHFSYFSRGVASKPTTQGCIKRYSYALVYTTSKHIIITRLEKKPNVKPPNIYYKTGI